MGQLQAEKPPQHFSQVSQKLILTILHDDIHIHFSLTIPVNKQNSRSRKLSHRVAA